MNAADLLPTAKTVLQHWAVVGSLRTVLRFLGEDELPQSMKELEDALATKGYQLSPEQIAVAWQKAIRIELQFVRSQHRRGILRRMLELPEA
jgi:hypothetical protein